MPLETIKLKFHTNVAITGGQYCWKMWNRQNNLYMANLGLYTAIQRSASLIFLMVPVWVGDPWPVCWVVFGPISVFWLLALVPKGNSAAVPPLPNSTSVFGELAFTVFCSSVFDKLACTVFCGMPVQAAGSLHSASITSPPPPAPTHFSSHSRPLRRGGGGGEYLAAM